MDPYCSNYEVDWQLPQDAPLADDQRPGAVIRPSPSGNPLAAPRSNQRRLNRGLSSFLCIRGPWLGPDASPLWVPSDARRPPPREGSPRRWPWPNWPRKC